MAMVDALLPEFDREMTITRRLLERVPEDKFAWKPHVKSMSLVELATHVATLPGWGAVTLKESEIDFAGQNPNTAATSRADLLARFDKNVSETRSALTSKSDAEMMAPNHKTPISACSVASITHQGATGTPAGTNWGRNDT